MMIRSSLSATAFTLAAAAAISGFSFPQTAEAARCTIASNGDTSCSYNVRYNYYWCNGVAVARKVRWQVPEGTAPSGGWRTAFLYQGTNWNDSAHPFSRKVGDAYGVIYEPRAIREMLDDPAGSGKKYAVFVPEPPNSSLWLEYWHTNTIVPYSSSCDYDFFPDFFGEIGGGSYGTATQYNLNRRFAWGISSGGYNTSRMAVTYNGSSVWKALAIVAASYATCIGSSCSVPTLPSNHPPTKFYHGTGDTTVPISTMRLYYDKMGAQGLVRSKVEHTGGHAYTSHVVGSGGVKAWFDAYY